MKDKRARKRGQDYDRQRIDYQVYEEKRTDTKKNGNCIGNKPSHDVKICKRHMANINYRVQTTAYADKGKLKSRKLRKEFPRISIPALEKLDMLGMGDYHRERKEATYIVKNCKINSLHINTSSSYTACTDVS